MVGSQHEPYGNEDDNEELDDHEENREMTPSQQKLDKNKTKIQDADKQRMKVEEYSKKIREIHRHWQETEKPWEDPDFPPFNASIFKDQAKLQEMVKEFKNWKWQRPFEINPKDAKFSIGLKAECDMKVGHSSDGLFIGALSMISTHPVVENLFIDVDNMEKGYVSFQFHKNGEWRYVIVDTLLPYYPETKTLLFSHCYEQNEFWVSLVEKAYAKLNGCYEYIQGISICETLVDLTGGVADKINLETPESKANIDSGAIFNNMSSYLNQNFILGSVKRVYGKTIRNAEAGEHGILENYYHGIRETAEFPKDDFRLVKIRNFWGPDSNWNGQFSNNSDEWDKFKYISAKLCPDSKNKIKDNYSTFFMTFDCWAKEFNQLYVCKVFPANWQKFSIDSQWDGKTAGGKYPDLEEQFPAGDRLKKPYVELDTDDKWFNNPQFRIRVYKKTKLIISLMQEDKRNETGANNYIKCNFIVVQSRQKKSRIWVKPDDKDIKCEALKDPNAKPKREITQTLVVNCFEGKNFGNFIVIPNTEQETKKSMSFWLRIFASEYIDVEELQETLEVSMKGTWNDSNAGGPRKLFEQTPGKKEQDNPKWC